MNFQQLYLQFSVLHKPSEIIFISWFGAKVTCHISINAEKLCCLWKQWKVQTNSIYLKLKSFCNIIQDFTVTFDQIIKSLMNKRIDFFKRKKERLTQISYSAPGWMLLLLDCYVSQRAFKRHLNYFHDQIAIRNKNMHKVTKCKSPSMSGLVCLFKWFVNWSGKESIYHLDESSTRLMNVLLHEKGGTV